MAAITGAKLWQSGGNGVNTRYDTIGKNSEVFAAGDIVGLSSGDLLVNTTAIVGVAMKTVTMASDNVTVAKVKPGFIAVNDETIWLMGTNSDLTSNAVDGGTYYPVTGGTGAQVLNVAGGVATAHRRTVMVLKVDPYEEGGTGAGSGLRKCLVRILSTPYTNVTITA